jgi:hypothetical protein
MTETGSGLAKLPHERIGQISAGPFSGSRKCWYCMGSAPSESTQTIAQRTRLAASYGERWGVVSLPSRNYNICGIADEATSEFSHGEIRGRGDDQNPQRFGGNEIRHAHNQIRSRLKIGSGSARMIAITSRQRPRE